MFVVLLLTALAPADLAPHRDLNLAGRPDHRPTQALVALPLLCGAGIDERRTQRDRPPGPDDHSALVPLAIDPETARRHARLSLRQAAPPPARTPTIARPRAPPR